MTQPRKTLPSLLTPALRGLLWFLLVPALGLGANTVYLVLVRLGDVAGLPGLSLGDASLPGVFQAMVLSHTGLGIVLVAGAVLFLFLHLRHVWKRQHRASIVSGITMGIGLVLLLVTGLFILTDAASRANRWVWWVHVVLALAVPAAFVVHRFSSVVVPGVSSWKRSGGLAAGVVTVLLVFHIAGSAGPATGMSDRADVAVEPAGTFTPVGWVDPRHEFFPSPVTTGSGGLAPAASILDRDTAVHVAEQTASQGFYDATPLGAKTCSRCHADVVAQWSSSAHRFSSFNNPFYEASILNLRESARANRWTEQHSRDVPAGVTKSQWCAGCHDPALLLTGQMRDSVDRGTVEAQAGLTCLACHQIDSLHDRTGNANFRFRDDRTDPYLFAGAAEGTTRLALHDAALRAKPTVHRRQMLAPLLQTSEFCATCHKVSLTEPVNDYRWVRGQNEFDNWDDSGVAHNAARTFYLPPAARRCQDCHMPLEPAPLGDLAAENGMVRSHRFGGPNTALPFLRGDTAMVRYQETFLRDGRLRVDVPAVLINGERRLRSTADAVTVQPGDVVTFEVAVRNLGVGHTFPGGTNDSNEGWLEFVLQNDDGDDMGRHGVVRPDGHLDPDAHVFKAVLVDQHGDAIQRRNAQDIRATVFASVIPPGAVNLAHYRFSVPSSWSGAGFQVGVTLRWRKFDRAFTEFSFRTNREGFPQFDDVPDLPITDIASTTVAMSVGGNNASTGITDEAEWMRVNDYGIGLLREGDTRSADDVFAEVERLRPDLVEGSLNRARVALADGNLAAALAHLENAEAVVPGDARVAWVWGQVLHEDGQYERAIAAYRRVLEAFPNDRATWRSLGRTYYLDLQYDESLEAFDQVLRIDPEDRVAHYHRMLILRAQGRTAEADAVAQAVEYYSIDESIQELTRRYQAEHPGANRMAQRIKVHDVRVR